MVVFHLANAMTQSSVMIYQEDIATPVLLPFGTSNLKLQLQRLTLY